MAVVTVVTVWILAKGAWNSSGAWYDSAKWKDRP